MVMIPKDSCEVLNCNACWKRCETMPVLGHIVSHDCSIAPDFENACATAWRAFWANPASKLGKIAGTKRQLKLFELCVTGSIAHVWSRWPPQKAIEAKLDQVQNSMMCTLINMHRNPNESMNSFMCRRGRAAKVMSRRVGLWSVEWRARAVRWYEHLKRHPESPGGSVLRYHSMEWLRAKRAEQLKKRNPSSLAFTLFAGWTDSRASRGKPCARFEEACESSRTR